MKYGLAKELEVAGFPQGGKGTWMYPTDVIVARSAVRVYAPTLEELIDACGDVDMKLNGMRLKRGPDWLATGLDGQDKIFQGSGSTPTDAVTRLWLALNSKPVE